MAKLLIMGLLTLFIGTGCVAFYAPIVWDYKEQAYRIIDADPLLAELYKRYDPHRETLRGQMGYDELVSPFKESPNLALFNPVTKTIYIKREIPFSDKQLREILIHEFSHHIWNSGLQNKQKKEWKEYQNQHPSVLQRLVRLYYPLDYDLELFAFTMQFPRKEDIKELLELKIISEPEGNVMLSKIPLEPKYDYWGMGVFDKVKKRK